MISIVMQAHFYKIFVFTALAMFGACSSLQLARQTPLQTQEAVFFAMGSRWSLQLEGLGKNEDFAQLKNQVVALALLYDRTFSDWSDESELRRLEAAGLDRAQQPSELFWEGLLLAQEAFELSEGYFDITTGAVLWNVADQAVGMQHLILNELGEEFYFTQDPLRLSFGGIAKGMALGEIASFLLQRQLQAFVVNAGGGDEIRLRNGQIEMIARSRVYLPQSQEKKHIFNPKLSRFEHKQNTQLKQTELSCKLKEARRRSQVLRFAALVDALATAQVAAGRSFVYCEQI